MSVFIKTKDYEDENRKYKRSKIVAKKVRFATQDKTHQCSISKCRYPSVGSVQISPIETRHLCKLHYDQYVTSGVKHNVIWVRGSSLLD